VRVDAALAEGQEIGVHFDPMLAKLSCWARDRDAAIARMQDALRRYVLLGVQTNLDHLQAVLAVPAFAEGDLTTAFLDEHLADWPPTADPAPLAMAATLLADRYGAGRSSHADGGAPDPLAGDPWRTLGRFRMGSGETS
jgi:acetyl/propionyl-CoA carboxylase alpha subunit